MKKIILIFLVVFLLLPIGCSKKATNPDPPPPPPDDPTTWAFFCRVRDASNDHFIKDARVEIGGCVGYTDLVGSVWLWHVPLGTRDLIVSKSGYETYRGEQAILANNNNNAEIFLIRAP